MQVLALAPLVPWLLRLPLPTVARVLTARRRPRVVDLDPERVARVVEAAQRFGHPLVRRGCLTRGVTLFLLLHTPGGDLRLCFGAGGPPDDFAGHCWLERDGRPFLERVDPRERFAEQYSIPPRAHAGPGGRRLAGSDGASGCSGPGTSGRLPPLALMRRVGWFMGAASPGEVFDERGREQWRLVRSVIPVASASAGRRILDFGCGPGRMLRAAVAEAPGAELWGADNHGPSVDWLRADLGDRARVLLTGDWPPLPVADEHFDVVYAFSVFTHLVDSWSAWLLELHRVLAPAGLLVITVVGPGRRTSLDSEPLDEDMIGMNVLQPHKSWDHGGPLVVHSEWWLRAHWGRAFEILELLPGDQRASPPQFGQCVVVMRKRPGAFTVEQLEAPEPGEGREVAALRQNIASLRREIGRHVALSDSLSWRVTAPGRRLAQAGRAGLRRVRHRT